MRSNPTFAASFTGQSDIAIMGEFDIFGAQQFRSLIRFTPTSVLTVDLHKMRFIDASGLGALVRASHEHCLVIVNPSERARRTFYLANLGNLL